jgi:hypothetical protein
MIDLIERFLGHINMHSSALNRISYKVVSSTQADQYIRAMEGDLEADCDSMLLISLCYGKQTVISEDRGRQESASADGVVGPAFDTEIILTDVEQAKHSMTYDLGLAETDAEWLTFATVRVMKNMRTRSQQAENRRQRGSKKRMSRTSRTEIKEKKEKKDATMFHR